MERAEIFFGVLASIAIVVGVGVYVSKNVDVTCWKIPYVTSGCTLTH